MLMTFIFFSQNQYALLFTIMEVEEDRQRKEMQTASSGTGTRFADSICKEDNSKAIA